MLGTGSVNLALPEQNLGALRAGVRTARGRKSHAARASAVLHASRTFQCPIGGCGKVYVNTRGGWDGHVGSLRNHPQWHPEITSAEQRKGRFEVEFPEFFD